MSYSSQSALLDGERFSLKPPDETLLFLMSLHEQSELFFFHLSLSPVWLHPL